MTMYVRELTDTNSHKYMYSHKGKVIQSGGNGKPGKEKAKERII